jgi:hypothetical protein
MSPLICYEPHRFGKRKRAMIDQANEIINRYVAQRFILTLRQLHYRFVAQDLMPNTQRDYKRLGILLSQARRAGLIDWGAIEDRGRNLRAVPTWESPQDLLNGAARNYREDLWADQEHYVEVWFEKDALIGVFDRAANPWRIPFTSCRGYTSDSEAWAAAQRFRNQVDAGRDVIVLHFGDHDPSGVDMSRDIENRLALFGAPDIEVRRVALNMDQIEKYEPPPNPAKIRDVRYAGYVKRFGTRSAWELDALEPTVVADLVKRQVRRVLDEDVWNAGLAIEEKARRNLVKLATGWDKVLKALNKPPRKSARRKRAS